MDGLNRRAVLRRKHDRDRPDGFLLSGAFGWRRRSSADGMRAIVAQPIDGVPSGGVPYPTGRVLCSTSCAGTWVNDVTCQEFSGLSSTVLSASAPFVEIENLGGKKPMVSSRRYPSTALCDRAGSWKTGPKNCDQDELNEKNRPRRRSVSGYRSDRRKGRLSGFKRLDLQKLRSEPWKASDPAACRVVPWERGPHREPAFPEALQLARQTESLGCI